jgi:hypothetical protein
MKEKLVLALQERARELLDEQIKIDYKGGYGFKPNKKSPLYAGKLSDRLGKIAYYLDAEFIQYKAFVPILFIDLFDKLGFSKANLKI